MIIDLAMLEADRAIETDVLIIGGGIAGLLLACKLRELKVPVVVLESGGREQVEQVHPLNKVIQVGEEYRGATQGRARCLGGTSTLWGGALIPFVQQDFDSRAHLQLPSWPVAMEELQPYIGQVEKLFGVDDGPYDETFFELIGMRPHVPVGDAEVVLRFAKWPVFRKRNIAILLKRTIEQDVDLSIWLNSTATSFKYDETAGRLAAVTARHSSGRAVTVNAKHIILCAGAIESTRLLLSFDRQSGGRIFDNCKALGRYFHDHVSAPAADIYARKPRELNGLAGFRFVGSTMRSLRFELSPSVQEAEGIGSVFGHISVETEGETGFDALRTFLRSLQRSGKIDLRAALKIAQDVPYLAQAGYWRYAHHQLRWPEPAQYRLHVVAEQAPRVTNRIFLSSELDAFGLPLATIDWHVEAAERITIQSFARRFSRYWNRHGLTSIGDLNWHFDIYRGDVGFLNRVGDVFHPGGTTRMGLDGKSAVVDQHLKTFAVSNLNVASTSVFPSGASSNPTMMLMLLTLRLAEHLGTKLIKR